MKATPDTVSRIASDFRAIADRFGFQPTPNPNSSTLWALYHRAMLDRRNDDNHPTIRRDGRVLPFDWHTPLYPDGTDDNTLRTALRAAYRQAFNLPA